MIEKLNQRLQSIGFKNRQSLVIRGIEVIRIDNDGFIIYIHPYAGIVQVGIEVDFGRIALEQWLLKNEHYEYGVAVIDKKSVLMGFLDISVDEIIENYKFEVFIRKLKEKLRELVHQLPTQQK